MNYYIPDSDLFIEQEFVDKKTYEYYKSKGWDVWRLFDPRLLYSVDKMRFKLDVPFTINNWAFGGNREWSGFRTPRSKYYSQYSMHNGRAVDIVLLHGGPSYDEIRKMMIDDPFDDAWKYITALEMTSGGVTIGWLHMDVRNHNKEKYGIKEIYM